MASLSMCKDAFFLSLLREYVFENQDLQYSHSQMASSHLVNTSLMPKFGQKSFLPSTKV
jgi:hypothetical protein